MDTDPQTGCNGLSFDIEVLMHCSSCNREIESENDLKRGVCFRCHVKGIRFGYTYGVENWRGPTVREIQRSYEESDAFKQGKIEKVPSRKELI